MTDRPRIVIPKERIADFCRRWKITELALFGSVLREDFRADSDVDVLVTFAPDATWSPFDHVDMEDELEGDPGTARGRGEPPGDRKEPQRLAPPGDPRVGAGRGCRVIWTT
jgi:predicted nucleotidyltransferase